MMDPMPHYSWIWPHRDPIPDYEKSICHLLDDAQRINKVATNPETIDELNQFVQSYKLELFANKWGTGIAIGLCVLHSSGLVAGIVCFICLVVIGHCTAWFNVTPRALKIIGAIGDESVITAANRRINSIHSNK